MDVKQIQKIEGAKIDKLYITAILFYEQYAKINALLEKNGCNDQFPICFELEEKEDVLDLIFFCPEWKKVLYFNDIEFKQTNNIAQSYHQRITQPQNNDVIILNFLPIIIENIYLDWESSLESDGTIKIVLKNFYKD